MMLGSINCRNLVIFGLAMILSVGAYAQLELGSSTRIENNILLGTTVTVTKSLQSPSGGSGRISASIFYPGQLSIPKNHKDDWILNRTRTIGAVTFRPASKTNYTFIFVDASRGSAILIIDVNKRIDRLCREKKLSVNSNDVVAEDIVGNTVTLTSHEYGVAHYHFRMRLSDNGDLQLLSYRISK